jgi:hypothetical protein
MGKRAPALGRKVKAGPITHLRDPNETWNGMHGPWCRCGDFPMERMPPQITVMPTSTIPLTPSITCPVCGMTSYNQTDIEQGYCGRCHNWTTPR